MDWGFKRKLNSGVESVKLEIVFKNANIMEYFLKDPIFPGNEIRNYDCISAISDSHNIIR